MIKIEADKITLVEVKDIKLNKKNRNKHPREQIQRLAEIIRHQGFRIPVVVSKRSGVLIAGEGRFHAAVLLGMDKIPAIVQDFESEEQEWAFGISDNAIASWAELDFEGINFDLPEMEAFDLDLLGIKGFTVNKSDKVKIDSQDKPKAQAKCETCGRNF